MSTRWQTLFELRSYAAQPGQRDSLIAMFEDIFLDAYQASGARILGTFRVLDDPDRWVWIRAFADAASRGRVLEDFYGGEVWKRNADECDALIARVDEAILLRAVNAEQERFSPSSGSCIYELAIHPLADGAIPDSTAILVTDRSENFYPRQPVRSDSVFVTLKRGVSTTARAANVEVLRLAPSARSALR